MFHLFFSKNPNLDVQDRKGWTMLHLALSSEPFLPFALPLLEAGANISISNTFGITALHQGTSSSANQITLAAVSPIIPMSLFRRILQCPNLEATLNALTKNGRSPLDYAIHYGREALTEITNNPA